MLQKMDVYYFSPTGGTKKVADMLARTMSEVVHMVDIGKECADRTDTISDWVIAAAPVFGGRIPAIVAERLKEIEGAGKHVITLVVYGNRAYEDALLELNNIMSQRHFKVFASGAFVAQHSMAAQVGMGRPDDIDLEEIRDFAASILEKIEHGNGNEITVPGNNPYKQTMKLPATPISLAECNRCGKCKRVCPVNAIDIEEEVVTDSTKCMLCMGCVSVCPQHARILLPPLKEKMEQVLGTFKNIRRNNEVFL